MTTDTPRPGPAAVRNEKPAYPLMRHTALGTDAQTLMSRWVSVHAEGSHTLDRDLFADKWRGYVTREQAEAYRPDARTTAAIEEIEAAGLATYQVSKHSPQGSLRVERTVDAYTVANGLAGLDGDDALDAETTTNLVEVFLVPRDQARNPNRTDGVRFATLVGATVDVRTDGDWPTLLVDVRHPSATDVDHSSARLARIEVAGVHQARSYTGASIYLGMLIDARLYAIGVDPALLDDDGQAVDEPYLCEHDSCPPHAHGVPYLPPARDDVKKWVPWVAKVVVTPMPVHRAQHAHTARHTARGDA